MFKCPQTNRILDKSGIIRAWSDMVRRRRRRPTSKSSATWPPIDKAYTYVFAHAFNCVNLKKFSVLGPFSRLNLLIFSETSRSSSVWSD